MEMDGRVEQAGPGPAREAREGLFLPHKDISLVKRSLPGGNPPEVTVPSRQARHGARGSARLLRKDIMITGTLDAQTIRR